MLNLQETDTSILLFSHLQSATLQQNASENQTVLVRANTDTDSAYPQSKLCKCFMRREMHLLCFHKPQRCTQCV